MFWNGWLDIRQCVYDQRTFFFRTDGGNERGHKRKTNKRKRKSDIVLVFKPQRALTIRIPRRRAKQRSPGPVKQFAWWPAEELILSSRRVLAAPCMTRTFWIGIKGKDQRFQAKERNLSTCVASTRKKCEVNAFHHGWNILPFCRRWAMHGTVSYGEPSYSKLRTAKRWNLFETFSPLYETSLNNIFFPILFSQEHK